MKPTKKSLTNKLDKQVSLIVRSLGRCVRCLGTDNLQCCHIFTRKNRSVRWFEDNLLCMDSKCHFWAHDNPVLFGEFVIDLLGIKRYNRLKKKAREIKQWKVWELEELLKKQEEKHENITNSFTENH